MAKYTVLLGINYPPDETRAEVGDVLDAEFAAPKVIKNLLHVGAISEITASKTSTDSTPSTSPTSDATSASAAPSTDQGANLA